MIWTSQRPARSPGIARADDAVDAGEYDEAIALYEELGDDDAAQRTTRTAAAVLVAREQRAAERRETRRIAREQAAAELAAEEDSFATEDSGGGSYAGMNCTEIGHSFTVEPGSDPEHDADNDGVACESQ